MLQSPLHRFQIGTIAVAVLLLTFIAGWNLRPLLENSTVVEREGVTNSDASVAVTIDRGNGTLEEMPQVPYLEGDSVLSVLEVLQDVGLVTLSLADLEDSVAAVDVAVSQLAESPDEPGWHFWVNDTYGTMPPQAYSLKPGDHIHFTFTAVGE
jgi:hypothetical protein